PLVGEQSLQQGSGLGRAVGGGIGLDTANEIARDISPVDKKGPEYVRADQCVGEIDPRIGSHGPNQEFDQSRGALIGLEQVPAAVDDDGRKWLLLSQHIVERIPDSGKFRRSELSLVPNRSEPRSE